MVSDGSKKPWFKSRTYWLNLVTGALALLAMPEVAAVLPAEWLRWIALANVLGNLAVRHITAGGVSLK